MINNNRDEVKLIGNFIFYNEDYMANNFGNNNLDKFQGYSKETIELSTMIDNGLKDIDVFYMLVEDYIYNLLIPSREGHKLLLKQSDNNDNLLNVYSLNYQDVMNEENILRRLRIKK